MSNIIFLLSSIRVKMNANEMENGEEGRGEQYRAYHSGYDKLRSGREWRGRDLIGLEQRKDRT